jgi:hypothetical protein
MKSPTHKFFMGAQFDRFLQEPIGEDSNGMRLTVLSVLARMDLDPWEEAATLTRLPGVAATRKLALLLAALPERLLAGVDSGTVAVRLISLLPGRLQPQTPARPSAAAVAAAGRPPVVGSLILYAMLMLLMFTGEWLITHAHAPPAQASAAPAPGTNAAAPSSATRAAQ